jgi:hypothetical protein
MNVSAIQNLAFQGANHATSVMEARRRAASEIL